MGKKEHEKKNKKKKKKLENEGPPAHMPKKPGFFARALMAWDEVEERRWEHRPNQRHQNLIY